MNYALDALWWKLQTPAVRDLAVLLTAPPPWLSGAELPVRTLLGEDGFRYLLALDDNPAPLQHFLQTHAPFGRRLGVYAEQLLAFWLAHAPHARLLAHNLPVLAANGQTAGAADFIAELNGTLYHIELACKYYGGADDWRGLNPQDTLAAKAAKLHSQLALANSSAFQAALECAGVSAEVPLHSVSVLRGMLFLPTATTPLPAPLNPYGWHGLWGTQWPPLFAAIADLGTVRFAALGRMDLLAPQRLPESQTQDAAAIQQSTAHGMVAVLQARPDGHWHEVRRLMKVASA